MAGNGRTRYRDWLGTELGEIVESVPLSEARKRYLRSRYIDQLLFMEGKALQAQRRYVRLRLATVVGAVTVPVLVGLDSRAGDADDVLRWATVLLSLVVAVCAAVEQFFHYGERWQHYRRHVERLKSEGWAYLELLGSYRRTGATHEAAFPRFAERVEALLRDEADIFVAEVVAERQQGEQSKG